MEYTIKPLNPASEVSYHDHPVIRVPAEKWTPIQQKTQDIAEQSYGSPEDHLTGKLGEWAFASYRGIEQKIDLSIYTDGGDGWVDIEDDGEKFQIKTIGGHRENPGLAIDHGEPLIADRYILANQIGKTDVQLIGWAPKLTVQEAREQNSMGDYFLISQEYLFPL